jgi:hypothetical protein
VVVLSSSVDAAVPVKIAMHGTEWTMRDLAFIRVFSIDAPSFLAPAIEGGGYGKAQDRKAKMKVSLGGLGGLDSNPHDDALG